MAERWARARLLGLDSSSEMLDDARGRAAEHPAERAARIEWRHGDIRTWRPNGRFDLIFSNAVLHWVEESHTPLLRRLASYLRGDRSCLAVQVPMNWDRPSHLLIGESLRSLGLPDERAAAVLRWADRRWVDPRDDYYRALAEVAAEVDLWTTEYLHPLTGEDPVLECLKGTSLRPSLAALQPEDRERFLSVYGQRLREAYPPLDDGTTLFPLRRLFMVATL